MVPRTSGHRAGCGVTCSGLRVLFPLFRLGLGLIFLVVAFIGSVPSWEASTVSALTSSVSEFQPNLSTKFGGRSTAVTINPSEPDTVISATESGGLFKSTDGGDEWSHIDTLIPYRIWDVKYAPNNASLVIATTWQNGDSVNPGGIWRSTDGGGTWQNTASGICGANFNAHGIAFEPSTTNIYVATDCGLSVSFDAGATWSIPAATTFERAHAVYAHPNATIDVCTNSGHRRFTRSGTTLTAVGGLNPIPGAGGGGCPGPNGLVSPHDISADPGDPQVLFVMRSGSSTTLCGGTVANPAGVGFLYESDDGGVNWTQIDSLCNPVRPSWVATHRSRNGNANDFDVYYSNGFSTSRLTCTTNVGSGSPRCTGPGAAITAAHPDHSEVAFVWDSTNCAKFLVNDGGIEESGDCGATFSFQAGSGSSNGNYNALQVYTVNGQVHPGDHTDLFFGAQDNRNWGSGDGGLTWPNQDCCEGGHFDLPHSAASDAGQRVVYFTCGPPCPNRQAGPHLTGAANWPNAPGTLLGADAGSAILVKGATDSYVQWTVVGGNNQLNRTPDAGGTWTAINGGTITQPLMSIPMVSGPPGDPTIYQAFCTVNCGFVAPAGGIMKITGAMGASATVTNISAGLGTLGTYNDGFGAFLLQEPALGVDPNNPLHLVAADVTSNMMKQSRDGGATWTNDAALTNLVTKNGTLAFDNIFFVGTQARAIAFSPANSNIILVGTESAGVIASFDNGNSWSRLPDSERVTSITSFFFDEVHNEIFVSSYGRGLWKVSLPSADLSITKTHSPEPAIAGEQLYYDLSVTNNGPDDATNVIVTDQLPPEVTFVTDNLPPPAGCTAVGQTVTCNLGTILSGDTVFFTIKVSVNADAVSDNGGPLSITNTATVGTPGATDPDLSNNTAVDTTIVEDSADLQVTKECKPDQPMPAGEIATCTIYVDNLGPSDARGVVLTDSHLSDGTFTIVSATASPGGACPSAAGVVTCDLGTEPAGGRTTVTVMVTADEGMDINDCATVSSDTPDPNTANNQACESITVFAVADLSITKSDNPDPVNAGEMLTYALTVMNGGPSTAVNVVASDILPPMVSVVSISASGASSCNAGTPGNPANPTRCTFDSLADGASRTMTIVVLVDPGAVTDPVTDQRIIHDDASVASDTYDPDNSNNLATEDTTVQALADLEVEKFSSGTPIAGTDILYTYHVSNHGSSNSLDVTFRDTLPAGVQFIDAHVDLEGGVGGLLACALDIAINQIVCPLGIVPPTDGVPIIIEVNVHIAANVPDGTLLTNSADLLTDTPDPDLANNTDAVTVAVQTQADVEVIKTADADTYKASGTVIYTIEAVNHGPSDAQGVVITDDLPLEKRDRVVFFSPIICTKPAGSTLLTCSLGTIPAGGSASVTVVVVYKGNRGLIHNTADVTATTTDPVVGNNSSTASVLIGTLPKP